ncbi:hypothetical protein HK405_001167, partial [Cladochytrium tenue]
IWEEKRRRRLAVARAMVELHGDDSASVEAAALTAAEQAEERTRAVTQQVAKALQREQSTRCVVLRLPSEAARAADARAVKATEAASQRDRAAAMAAALAAGGSFEPEVATAAGTFERAKCVAVVKRTRTSSSGIEGSAGLQGGWWGPAPTSTAAAATKVDVSSNLGAVGGMATGGTPEACGATSPVASAAASQKPIAKGLKPGGHGGTAAGTGGRRVAAGVATMSKPGLAGLQALRAKLAVGVRMGPTTPTAVVSTRLSPPALVPAKRRAGGR